MYSKEEAGKLKTEFWTAFGQYMLPVPSAEGEKINWINYRTGQKYIRIKTDADTNSGFTAMIINHPDAALRHYYFEQLLALKNIFDSYAGTSWSWQKDHITSEGMISKISVSYTGSSIYNKVHWPEIISFFKQHLISLDAFWCEVKYVFED